MTKNVISVSPETSLFDAAKLLYKYRFNGLPVVDHDNVLVGILTEYDLVNIDSAIHVPTLQRILRHIVPEKDGVERELETIVSLKVGGVMNDDPLTLAETAMLEEVVAAFTQHHRVNPIPIIDKQKKVVGIISRSDLIKFFVDFPVKPAEAAHSKPRLSEFAASSVVEKSVSLLEEKLTLLQLTVASSEQPILITDPDAKILFINKAWEKLTGYSAKEILGKHPNDLWGGHMPKEFYEELWRTIKTEKKPFVGVVKNVKKDGTEYWQDDYITPILDENGNIKFFMSIEPDITDKKQKEQFREEFISIVGHQLRNPLIAINWMVEWLSKSVNLTEEDKKKIEEIYKENKNLSNFVNDLLALSRADKTNLTQELLDLRVEVENIIKEVRQANPAVTIDLETVGENLTVAANKSLATQVFSNLIYNAAEYSDKKDGKVDVVLEKKDSAVVFSVRNNGPEIAEEDKPRIFSKLFRSAEAVKIKKSGTGLGLFIVKTITDNLGWEIRFDSGAGQGTTFYVKIPIENGKHE